MIKFKKVFIYSVFMALAGAFPVFTLAAHTVEHIDQRVAEIEAEIQS